MTSTRGLTVLIVNACIGCASWAATPSSVVVTTSNSSPIYGSPVTITATLNPPGGTGLVAFYDGVTVIGLGSVANNVASITTIVLPTGVRRIHAYYSGNAAVQASVSRPISVTVLSRAGNGFIQGRAFPDSALAADFNGDQKIDIAFVNGTQLCVAPGNGDGTFGNASCFTGDDGRNSVNLAAGDFNGDGKLDIAAGVNGSEIDIWLGNGDLTFAQAVSYKISYPATIVPADFNNDGKIDLVVSSGDRSLFVLLGNGDGTFAPPSAYGTAETFQPIVGDFNGDGNADILYVDLSAGLILLQGVGDGTFSVHNLAAENSNIVGTPLALADFNGDGTQDLLMAVQQGGQVLAGDGRSGFSPLPAFQAAGLSNVVADFNGDGIPDLFSTNGVLLGDGKGGFQLIPGTPPFGLNESFVAADLNDDGIVDILTSLGALFGAPSVDLDVTMNHSGNFQQGQASATYSIVVNNVGAAASVDPVTVATFLATQWFIPRSVFGTGWTCTLYPSNNGPACTWTGTLAAGQSLPPVTLQVSIAANAPQTITPSVTVSVAGDINAANNTAQDPTTVIQPQTLSFGPVQSRALGSPPFQINAVTTSGLAANFTATGSCSVSGNFVNLLQVGLCTITADQPGNAAFLPAISVTRTFSVIAASAIVAISSGSSFAASSQPVVLTAQVNPADATGTVAFYDGSAVLGVAPLASGRAMLTAKFILPGKRLLRAHYSGDSMYAGGTSPAFAVTITAQASTGFGAPVSFLPGTYGEVAVGDMNGDGIPDVVIFDLEPNGYVITVSLGNGDGTFRVPVIKDVMGGVGVSATPYTGRRIVLADFNQDGKLDVIISDSLSGRVSVFLGNGDGSVGNPSTILTSAAGDLSVADFNGDGIADVAATIFSSQGGFSVGFSLLLGKGDGTFYPAATYVIPAPAPSGSVNIASGDISGDGIPDIVAVSGGGGAPIETSVFLGRGDGTLAPAINRFEPGPVSIANAGGVALADLNGDGKLDVIIQKATTIEVILGNGDGTLGKESNFLLALSTVGGGNSLSSSPPLIFNAFPVGMAIADFNGDGTPDILAAYNSVPPAFQFLAGNPDGTLRSPIFYTHGNGLWSGAAAGDFNGDGFIDLVTADGYIAFGGAYPLLRMSVSHKDPFYVGSGGAAFSIIVSNAPGAVNTVGAVNVKTQIFDTGGVLSGVAGSGWACDSSGDCSRNDLLAGGASWPALSVTIDVSSTDLSPIPEVSDVTSISGGNSPARWVVDTGTIMGPADISPVAHAIENAANFQVRDMTHATAPNTIISVYATGIGTVTSPAQLFPATAFNGVQVLANGIPMPLYNVVPSAGLINVVVPSEIKDGAIQMTVQTPFGITQNLPLKLAPDDVGIFRLGADPSHPNNGAVTIGGTAWIVAPASTALAYHLPGCTGVPAQVGCSRPARPGEYITVYFTGGGLATPSGNPSGFPISTGSVAPVDGSVLYETVATPVVTIGGIQSEVLFSGIAPGTGSEYQVNTIIPAGVKPGDSVPLTITLPNSSDSVTLAVATQ